MISSIEVRQTITSTVALEHPDDWTADDVATAAANRQMDIALNARMYCGTSKSNLGALAFGVDPNVETTDPGDMAMSMYDEDPSVELTEDDLAAPASIMITDAGADE